MFMPWGNKINRYSFNVRDWRGGHAVSEIVFGETG
jgi:hypothetical protein